jgi:cytochrome b561
LTGKGADRPAAYSRVQIVLHWAIAGLILVQFAIHEAIELAFDRWTDVEPGGVPPLAMLHIVIGGLVLVMALWRIGLRLRRGAPPSHEEVPWPARWTGHGVHFALYLLLLVLPLSGLWAWVMRSGLAAEVHEAAAAALVLLTLAHALGAAAEHFLFRNDSLTRMVPGLRPRPAKGASPGT